MNRRSIAYVIVALITVAFLGDCRPRGNRNATKQNTTTTQQTQPASQTLTPQQVLSHTDSAITRVAEMNTNADDIPAYASDQTAPQAESGSNEAPTGGEYETYQAGLGSYNSGAYDQAINSFAQVVQAGRPPELVPNAFYWIGESYFAMQRYSESLPYFQYVTKAGPEYKRQMAFYKLAVANDNLGNRDAANLWYERLNNEYPGSSYAKRLAGRGLK